LGGEPLKVGSPKNGEKGERGRNTTNAGEKDVSKIERSGGGREINVGGKGGPC